MNRTNKHRCDDGNDDGNEGDDGDNGIDGIDGLDDEDEDEDEEEEDDIDDGSPDGDDDDDDGDDDDDDDVDEDDDIYIKLSHTQQFYAENALTQKHLTEELVWACLGKGFYKRNFFCKKSAHRQPYTIAFLRTKAIRKFFWEQTTYKCYIYNIS